MSKTADQVKHISSADGEVVVNAESKTSEELLKIASASGMTGGRMIIVNVSSIEKELLMRLAYLGKGNVLFDLR